MKKLGRGAIAAAGTTLYTVPTGYRADVMDINLANTTDAKTDCALHLVPAGDSPTSANMLFPNVEIPANTLVQWTGVETIYAGDSIVGVSSVAAAVTATITGNEYRASV